MKTSLLRLVAAACVALLQMSAAQAQSYPSKPITAIVPFAAGGATDVVARLLSKDVSEQLKQSVVIDNRAGAAGAIGAAAVARSAPDGYTFCFCGGGPLVILKSLDPSLSYDPFADFAPVTLTHLIDFVVGVPVDSPYHSMRDLVAAAKAKPNALSYASTGVGGPSHLGQEFFNRTAGVQINHVPYKGESQFMPDLVSGRLAIGILSAQLGDQAARAGKVRLIGAWSEKRLQTLPNLPTVAEQGYPQFSAGTFVGIVVPRGTPQEVVNRLNAAFVSALKKPDIHRKMVEMGFTPVGDSPAAFATFLHREEVKWSKVVSDLGLKGRN